MTFVLLIRVKIVALSFSYLFPSGGRIGVWI